MERMSAFDRIVESIRVVLWKRGRDISPEHIATIRTGKLDDIAIAIGMSGHRLNEETHAPFIIMNYTCCLPVCYRARLTNAPHAGLGEIAVAVYADRRVEPQVYGSEQGLSGVIYVPEGDRCRFVVCRKTGGGLEHIVDTSWLRVELGKRYTLSVGGSDLEVVNASKINEEVNATDAEFG